jgi:hypothetical protein
MTTTTSRSKLLKSFAIIFSTAFLFSFTAKPGGEGFEVFLNNKVVLQQFGSAMKTVKTLSLEQAAPNDQLAIIYHHCGQMGKDRVLTIKDNLGNTLKKWNFKDEGSKMVCRVKDLLSLQKGNGALTVFYSSKELPEGRELAILSLHNQTVATR